MSMLVANASTEGVEKGLGLVLARCTMVVGDVVLGYCRGCTEKTDMGVGMCF